MNTMNRMCKAAAVGTAFGGWLMFAVGLGTAGAEPAPPPPPPAPDGLVNVVQGDTTALDNVPVADAVAVVTQLCGAAAPDALGLVQQVDAQSLTQVACAGMPAGDVVVSQNLGTSPVFPSTEGAVDPSEEPAAPVPPGAEESADDTTGVGAGEPPEVPEGEDGPEPNNPGFN